MFEMKKIGKLAAGILSLVLVFGAVGSAVPLSTGRSSVASAAAQKNEDGFYEYVIEDAYIVRINDDYNMPYIYLMPKVYDSYGYRSVEIFLDQEDIIEEFEDGEYKVSLANPSKSYQLLQQLSEETVATITFFTDKEEDLNDLNECLNGSSYKRSCYMSGISSVKSLDIHYYGDINDDGVVDSFDVISYRKQLAGNAAEKLTEAQFLNGDINGNTEIDEDDLQQVQDYLLGKTKEFNGASAIGSIRLDNTVQVQAAEGKTTDEKFAAAEMKFGIDILKQCFDPTVDGEENLLISPLSVSTALAMTANGADGETRAQMEKVLGNGLTVEELNEYIAYYISKLPDEKKTKVYLADSIWFKDKQEFQVYDEFLESNKKYYNAEIYKTLFDDSTVNDVNSWVNQNTRGMIPSLLKNGALDPKGNKEILMLLINTLYFEAEWRNKYTDSTDGIFTDLKGEEHTIKKMNSKESEYFDLGDADAFKKPYAGGEYSFVGILPRDKDIVEYVNDLDAEKLSEGLKECVDPSTVDLYVMIPKFKYNYSKSLKEILPKLGMANAFDPDTADFSKINDMSVPFAPLLYIDDVLHKTKIEVTERGTKAAAVTAVIMANGTGMPMPKKEVYINLDRPFVYMIVDKNNVPLFIGAATQLEEK